MAQTRRVVRHVVSVGIGIFALWQLVFIPAANIIDFLPRRLGPNDVDPVLDPFQEEGICTEIEPIQRGVEIVGDILDGWSELTGQDQGWKLFSPGTPTHSLFVAVEFHFVSGERVQLRSEFEPVDLRQPPIRAPLIRNRTYNVESQFTTMGWYSTPESLERYPEVWSRELPKSVRDNHRFIQGFLEWHLKKYLAKHPESKPPAEVVLVFRYIETPLPGKPKEWTQPALERPYARWLVAGPGEPGYLSLEGFDPITNRFISFPIEGTR